jgi:hypothetical protein
MFQKKTQVNDLIPYDKMKIQFHSRTIDNKELEKHFALVYGKKPNDLQNSYTGFIFMASYKLFYSLIREIIHQKDFQKFLIEKF